MLDLVHPGEMSMTGYWIMGAVPPGALRALREDIDATRFMPVGSADDLDWWAAMDHAALPGPDRRNASSEPAVWFESSLDGLRPGDEALTKCIDAMHDTVDDGAFAVGARKGDPVAALCYGLTFGAARRLPGRAGCFLLDETGARTVLADVGPLLERPPRGRPAFSDRVTAWRDVMTDAPELEPIELLDGPLRVLRRAVETGSAVIAVTQWY